ncbi:MAG: glutamyl-tRNA reductase [Verrucomicrobia bacterium]|nr:glutamyl-tRNA reductase [Verrucomicrobiota bacterium]
MALIVVGLNHRTAPLTLREQFAVAQARVPATLHLLRQEHIADEAVILSTCNRVEFYIATALAPGLAFDELRAFLVHCARYRDPLTDEIYRYSEPRSLEHLFRVACGIDSMVLGETEILGQLKQAYELALQHGHTGKVLNQAFQKAFHIAKAVRTQTSIQRGSISVASVAVDLAEKIFNSLSGREVIIVGAGDTGEKAARALLSRGARGVLVANRSPERARALALELGGRAVLFEEWIAECQRVDIAITTAAAPHYLLDRTRLEPVMRARRHRPLLLVDIAVPRNIDPEVHAADDVYLYNIDDLQGIADDALKRRQAEIGHCEAIIRDKARSLLRSPSCCGLPLTPAPAL